MSKMEQILLGWKEVHNAYEIANSYTIVHRGSDYEIRYNLAVIVAIDDSSLLVDFYIEQSNAGLLRQLKKQRTEINTRIDELESKIAN